MPDFTLCNNAECTHATHCGRSPKSGTIPNYQWQAWSNFAPDPMGICAYRIQAIPPNTPGKPKDNSLE